MTIKMARPRSFHSGERRHERIFRVGCLRSPVFGPDGWFTGDARVLSMDGLVKFVIRLALSTLFAIIVAYLFFGSPSVVRVGGFALGFLGFAYLFEYTKKRDKGGEDGS